MHRHMQVRRPLLLRRHCRQHQRIRQRQPRCLHLRPLPGSQAWCRGLKVCETVLAACQGVGAVGVVVGMVRRQMQLGTPQLRWHRRTSVRAVHARRRQSRSSPLPRKFMLRCPLMRLSKTGAWTSIATQLPRQ